MRRMLAVVVDRLVRNFGLLVSSGVVAGVRVAVPKREPAAGDVQADPVALAEHSGRGQQLQRILAGLTGCEQLAPRRVVPAGDAAEYNEAAHRFVP